MNTMDLEQKKYFDRQIKLPLLGEEGQTRLLNSKVLVVGAGGLGCPALQYLVSMGIGEISVVDHDIIDSSNLHRQILYNQNDIGKSKALTACEKLRLLGPWTSLISYDQYLTKELAIKLIEQHDLVIDCTDNFGAKFLIHDCCYRQKTNLIQASIHKFDGQIQVFPFAHSTDRGCLRCLWEKIPEHTGDCNDNGVLGIVPGVFGSLQASEAIKLLLGHFSEHNEVVIIDLFSLNFHKMKYHKNQECHFCQVETHECSSETQQGEFMNDLCLKFNEINPSDYTWLDIRMATMHEELPSNIPADQVIKKTDAEIMHGISDFTQERPFVVICDRGIRSQNLANALRDHGHSNVYSLVGGFMGLNLE